MALESHQHEEGPGVKTLFNPIFDLDRSMGATLRVSLAKVDGLVLRYFRYSSTRATVGPKTYL